MHLKADEKLHLIDINSLRLQDEEKQSNRRGEEEKGKEKEGGDEGGEL